MSMKQSDLIFMKNVCALGVCFFLGILVERIFRYCIEVQTDLIDIIISSISIVGVLCIFFACSYSNKGD